MLKSLSDLLVHINIEDFVTNYDVTPDGLREWGILNKVDMDYYCYFDLLKIIEYIEDKVYENR
jgi:hypothetical protein